MKTWEIQDGQIQISIPSANKKLLTCFPNDPRADIKITFGSKAFYLSKPHLRLQSQYFRRTCGLTTAAIQIKSTLASCASVQGQEAFEKVISCFYGAQIKLEREKVGIYYRIVYFLGIQTLLSQLKQDITKNIHMYNLFELLGLAQKLEDQQLFELCFQNLEKQSYQSLRVEVYQLTKLGLPLLKLVLQSQAEYLARTGKGIPTQQVIEIIKIYCQARDIERHDFQDLQYNFVESSVWNASQQKEAKINDKKECDIPSSIQESQKSFSKQLRLPLHPITSSLNLCERKRKNSLKEKNENLQNVEIFDVQQKKKKRQKEILNVDKRSDDCKIKLSQFRNSPKNFLVLKN